LLQRGTVRQSAPGATRCSAEAAKTEEQGAGHYKRGEKGQVAGQRRGKEKARSRERDSERRTGTGSPTEMEKGAAGRGEEWQQKEGEGAGQETEKEGRGSSTEAQKKPATGSKTGREEKRTGAGTRTETDGEGQKKKLQKQGREGGMRQRGQGAGTANDSRKGQGWAGQHETSHVATRYREKREDPAGRTGLPARVGSCPDALLVPTGEKKH